MVAMTAVSPRTSTCWHLGPGTARNGKTLAYRPHTRDTVRRVPSASKAYAGTAPVTRASGKSLQVVHRKIKDNRHASTSRHWCVLRADRITCRPSIAIVAVPPTTAIRRPATRSTRCSDSSTTA